MGHSASRAPAACPAGRWSGRRRRHPLRLRRRRVGRSRPRRRRARRSRSRQGQCGRIGHGRTQSWVFYQGETSFELRRQGSALNDSGLRCNGKCFEATDPNVELVHLPTGFAEPRHDVVFEEAELVAPRRGGSIHRERPSLEPPDAGPGRNLRPHDAQPLVGSQGSAEARAGHLLGLRQHLPHGRGRAAPLGRPTFRPRTPRSWGRPRGHPRILAARRCSAKPCDVAHLQRGRTCSMAARSREPTTGFSKSGLLTEDSSSSAWRVRAPPLEKMTRDLSSGAMRSRLR